ncbi:DUF6183 family protein [Streptomyces sp. P9(2023)]|uniref:DUF6183 family protein n=1 Tax=Streptomyces sp. P9(2023) TaxID=3064394 RepID=UPI0028F415B6|nr:DUF6183 family protein [Streptomyces sp. P9(2023)]MDT9689031.1 DUF6183 family protein [Streptomyces sp. P9(2023)]
MPEPTALPDDASLKVYAVTDPERLYSLATEPPRVAGSLSAPEIMSLAELLARQRSQAATDWAVRLGEYAARRTGAPGAVQLMAHVVRELVRRPSSATLPPYFELPPKADDPDTEFRACLLQEMALRWGLDREPYTAYQAGLRELGHPLAWLPLASFYFESAMRERAWWRGSTLGSLKSDELHARYPEIPPTAAGALAGRGARRAPDDRRTEAAMDPLAELASSAVEFFTMPEPLDPADFNSALLTAIGSRCLAGLTPDTLAAAHTTADDLAGDLCVAAFSGGVWGDGRPGAYVRLSTWRALYALMDLDPSVPHTRAVRAAAEYRWLRLALARRSGNDFFFGDLSDMAFAVLDPTRTRVAIIAASDTD